MKFSKDTSRLVKGRVYWCAVHDGENPEPTYFGGEGSDLLWGDEYVLPTVEVEPERPAAPALLPCPFCGGTETGTASSGGYVFCVCGSAGPFRTGSPSEAIAAWNTRAAPTPPAEPSSIKQGEWVLSHGKAEQVKSKGGFGVLFFESGGMGHVDSCTPIPAPAERPAWTPPVCPAGQLVYDEEGGYSYLANETHELYSYEVYPKPDWPPRIGEHINFHYANFHYTDSSEWAHVPCLSVPMKDSSGRWYVLVPCGRAYQNEEGQEWEWVYRDLSDYTPPGGE